GCAVTGGEGTTLLLWEVDGWRRLRALEGHAGVVNAVAFGALLVSGDSRGGVIVWDLDVVRRVDAARARAAGAEPGPAALRAHAAAQAASERWAGALRLLTRAGQEGESAAETLLRARALAAVGRAAEARAAFERARALAPPRSAEAVAAAVWLRGNVR